MALRWALHAFEPCFCSSSRLISLGARAAMHVSHRRPRSYGFSDIWRRARFGARTCSPGARAEPERCPRTAATQPRPSASRLAAGRAGSAMCRGVAWVAARRPEATPSVAEGVPVACMQTRMNGMRRGSGGQPVG